VRILYNTSSCLSNKPSQNLNNLSTLPLFSHFFHYLANVTYLISSWYLHQNSHWWSPIMSSTYGVNLKRRILDITLYVAEHWYSSIVTTINVIALFINRYRNGHGMAQPEVADGGKASRYGGQVRTYWIRSRDSRQEVVLQPDVGCGANNPSP